MEEKIKKGCFNLMLAAILSLAIAGTAYAFKFDFHGKMWQTVGLTKARLRFEGTTDDGLAKIVYGLEVGTINWGDTNSDKKFGLSGDGADHLAASDNLYKLAAGIKISF